MTQWEPVIGLELHVQLATESKIFSSAPAAFGAPANTHANPVDIGMPGVLPVLNEKAVRMAIKFGLAINAQIASVCRFDRKNYFYPDLPKGYQISQLDQPIVGHGVLPSSWTMAACGKSASHERIWRKTRGNRCMTRSPVNREST